jgi:hypothetical protein
VDDVVVAADLRIHWQLAEVEDLADAAAQRHGPSDGHRHRVWAIERLIRH